MTPDTSTRELIDALALEGSRREAAIARLIIAGRRVTPRLLSEYSRADRPRKIAILRVLEGSGDERALPVARAAVAEGGDVAVAAVAVLRELLRTSAGPADAQALDTLLGLAGDANAEHRARAAAREALSTAPADVRSAIEALAQGEPRDVASGGAAAWRDALEGRLPDDPAILIPAVDALGRETPLTVLRRLVEGVAERERTEPLNRRRGWRTLRGALHQVLALRDSRIALYDLREALSEPGMPVPATFLAALQMIGDATCLEPLAAAFLRTDARDRHRVAHAMRAIVRRERLTRRHAAVRRALAAAPDLPLLRDRA